jgi:hypothetical protein
MFGGLVLAECPSLPAFVAVLHCSQDYLGYFQPRVAESDYTNVSDSSLYRETLKYSPYCILFCSADIV